MAQQGVVVPPQIAALGFQQAELRKRIAMQLMRQQQQQRAAALAQAAQIQQAQQQQALQQQALQDQQDEVDEARRRAALQAQDQRGV